MPVNQLLATLTAAEYERLAPYLERVTLSAQQLLHAPGEPISAVYFPTAGLISLVTILENGATSETGLIGHEGVVGFPAFLGGNLTTNHAIVQIAGSALRLEAEFLKREFERSQQLRQRLLLYTQAFLTQVSQTAICNGQHGTEQRVARWLLWARDCALQDELVLSLDFIANLLGIQTQSAIIALQSLQQCGILRYQADRIEILAVLGLETKACECYRRVRDEYYRLLAFPQR
ncbi:Crp/Fnr family transcriptional regulator [Oscillatoria sp. FACHB-1406]|nr:Crp/Fnr family transcriptional regulator [Oscillatoria sp. FACHB-1406]